MRLRRLTLARYGKFTDQTIDFGEVVELAEAEVKRLSAAVEVIAVDARALGLAGGLDRLTALAARNLTAEIVCTGSRTVRRLTAIAQTSRSSS